MVRFLNRFSRKCEGNNAEQNLYLELLFSSFLSSTESLLTDAFINRKNNRFNIALYEAVFTASSREAFRERRTLRGSVPEDSVLALSGDPEFVAAAVQGTTRTVNVKTRLERANNVIPAL